MTTDESTEKQSVDEIEAEIEATREELGATVDELSHRLDVKARAGDKVADVKAQAQEKVHDTVHQVQEKAADVGGQVSHGAQTAKGTVLERTEGVRTMAAAHPREAKIAAGGAVALLGAALIRRRRG